MAESSQLFKTSNPPKLWNPIITWSDFRMEETSKVVELPVKDPQQLEILEKASRAFISSDWHMKKCNINLYQKSQQLLQHRKPLLQALSIMPLREEPPVSWEGSSLLLALQSIPIPRWLALSMDSFKLELQKVMKFILTDGRTAKNVIYT